jgi:hypothetical protein
MIRYQTFAACVMIESFFILLGILIKVLIINLIHIRTEYQRKMRHVFDQLKVDDQFVLVWIWRMNLID